MKTINQKLAQCAMKIGEVCAVQTGQGKPTFHSDCERGEKKWEQVWIPALGGTLVVRVSHDSSGCRVMSSANVGDGAPGAVVLLDRFYSDLDAVQEAAELCGGEILESIRGSAKVKITLQNPESPPPEPPVAGGIVRVKVETARVVAEHLRRTDGWKAWVAADAADELSEWGVRNANPAYDRMLEHCLEAGDSPDTARLMAQGAWVARYNTTLDKPCTADCPPPLFPRPPNCPDHKAPPKIEIGTAISDGAEFRRLESAMAEFRTAERAYRTAVEIMATGHESSETDYPLALKRLYHAAELVQKAGYGVGRRTDLQDFESRLLDQIHAVEGTLGKRAGTGEQS